MDTHADRVARPGRRRLAVLGWGGFVLLCGGFIFYRWWGAREFDKVTAQWRGETAARDGAGMKLRNDIWASADGGRSGLEREFNRGKPFRTRRVVAGEPPVCYLDDPASGWTLSLGFSPEGQLVYCYFYAEQGAPRPSALWRALEHARQYIAGYGLILWLVVLAETLIYSRAARMTGQLLLAITLLIGLTWLCGPYGFLGARFELIDHIMGIEAPGGALLAGDHGASQRGRADLGLQRVAPAGR